MMFFPLRLVPLCRAFACIAVYSTVAVASAENSTRVEPEDKTPLSLALGDCIRMALSENIELQVDRLEPPVAYTKHREERGAFEPSLEMSADWTDTTTPKLPDDIWADRRALKQSLGITSNPDTTSGAKLPPIIRSTESEKTDYKLGLSGLVPTGLAYDVFAEASNSETTTRAMASDWNSSVGVSLTQPLLRDFGPAANLTQLRVARKGKEVADAQFEHSVASLVTNLYRAYHELIYSIGEASARADSLRLARKLLEENQARYEVGVMSPLDVSQARSEAATREGEWIKSAQNRTVAANRLKRLIYSDIAAHTGEEIRPTEPPLPPAFASPFFNALAALNHRADLRQAKAEAEQAGISLRYAQNQLLPTVDARGGYRLLGRENTVGESLNSATDAYDREWSAGVVVGIPLGMSAERAQASRADLQKRQALLAVKAVEQDILVEVDNALASVRANEKRYQAARQAESYALEALNAEEEKLRAGTTTTYTVMQLQRDYSLSVSNALRALADWHISIAELALAEGTILQNNGIVVGKNGRVTRAPSAQTTTQALPE